MLNSNRQYLANIFSTKLDAWNFIPSEVAEPNNIIGSINVNVDFIDTTRATLSLTPDNDGIEILLCGKFDYWYIDSFDQMPESDFMECLTTVTDNYDGVTVRETKNNGEFEVAASISLDVLTEDNIYTEIGATIAKLNEFGYDLGEELEEKDLQDYDFYPFTSNEFDCPHCGAHITINPGCCNNCGEECLEDEIRCQTCGEMLDVVHCPECDSTITQFDLDRLNALSDEQRVRKMHLLRIIKKIETHQRKISSPATDAQNRIDLGKEIKSMLQNECKDLRLRVNSQTDNLMDISFYIDIHNTLNVIIESDEWRDTIKPVLEIIPKLMNGMTPEKFRDTGALDALKKHYPGISFGKYGVEME